MNPIFLPIVILYLHGDPVNVLPIAEALPNLEQCKHLLAEAVPSIENDIPKDAEAVLACLPIPNKHVVAEVKPAPNQQGTL